MSNNCDTMSDIEINGASVINCSICVKQFTRFTYLKNHLQTNGHIKRVKELKAKTIENLPNKNKTSNTEDIERLETLVENNEDEDSVVPSQIYPALIQKRALALCKKQLAERRQQQSQQEETPPTSTSTSTSTSTNTNSEITYTCGGCTKQYANKSNLNRHEKKCTEAIELKEELFAKHKNIKKKAKPHKSLGNITININIDNSQNTNQNIWNQLNMNPFGYEDISILQNKQVIDKIHGRGMNAFDELLNQIYSLPSNRNIAITNQRKNLAKYINSNGEVKITDQEKLLNDLVMNHVDILDEFLTKTIKEIDPRYKRTIDKLMSQHELDDNPNIARYVGFAYFLMLNITEDGLKNIGKFKKTVDDYISKSLVSEGNSSEGSSEGSSVISKSTLPVNNPKLSEMFKLPPSIRRISP